MKKISCLLYLCGACAYAEDLLQDEKENTPEIIVGAALGYSHDDCRLILDRAYIHNAEIYLPDGRGGLNRLLVPMYSYIGEPFGKLSKGKVSVTGIVGISLPLSKSVSVRLDTLFDIGKNSKSEFDGVIGTTLNGSPRHIGKIENRGNTFQLRLILESKTPFFGLSPYIGTGLRFGKTKLHFDISGDGLMKTTVERSYNTVQPMLILGANKKWCNLSVFCEYSYVFKARKNSTSVINYPRFLVPDMKSDIFFTAKQHGYALRIGMIYSFKIMR